MVKNNKKEFFDIKKELSKKETKLIQKLEGAIEFNMAHVPAYNVHESDEYKRAQELKLQIKSIEEKCKLRWDSEN